MSKLDINNWGEFRIDRLFSVVKGTRLTKANMKDGNIRFIGASSVNNGITAFISNDDHLHPNNTITINYNGSVGEAFYQDERFWASDDVNVLYPKFSLNSYIARFIVPLLKKAGQQYAFIDKWKKEDMEKDFIKLPKDENDDPDWGYMELCMKKLEIAANSSLTKLQLANKTNRKKIDTTTWEESKINDIFPIIIKPVVYHTREVEQDESGIPYVVRSKYNNGIKYRVKKPSENINPARVISFGAENATFFYQKSEWVSGRDIYYIDTTNINEYACLFITACLKPIANKYTYNFGLFPDLLKEEIIKLPVYADGKPNWDYMESYMKNIETTVNSSLTAIK